MGYPDAFRLRLGTVGLSAPALDQGPVSPRGSVIWATAKLAATGA